MFTEVQHTPRFAHVRRRKVPACFIVHSTGDKDLDKILKYYTTSSSGIGPHCMIDYDGTRHLIVADNRVAYHAGFGDPEQTKEYLDTYRRGWNYWSRRRKGKLEEELPSAYVGYITWHRRWGDAAAALPENDTTPRRRGLESPLELVAAGSPNGISYGIELREPQKNDRPDHFTDEQYASLAEYITGKSAAGNIVITRETVLGHYDVHPIGRGDRRGDWDPGEAFNWDRLLKAAKGS